MRRNCDNRFQHAYRKKAGIAPSLSQVVKNQLRAQAEELRAFDLLLNRLIR